LVHHRPSRGFGRIWAEAALKRGDKVTATARKLADVADLKERFGDAVLPLGLDVTDPEQVQQVVQQGYEHFGRLDILLNNAGVRTLTTENFLQTTSWVTICLPWKMKN
jgi:NADP-dependent 3-hydroxy acid dehydrogenase YdfG